VPPIISDKQLAKTCASGFHALKNIDLEIRRGELFDVLGPNGAGRTALFDPVPTLSYCRSALWILTSKPLMLCGRAPGIDD
jgi:ABC-type branched-subunit amino acid transport system ATPase component